LDSRYSTLLDRIDNLEKPLLDLQSSSSSISEKEREEKTDDDHQLQQRYDTLSDYVNKFEEDTKKNLIVDTTDSDKQIATLPSDEHIIASKDEKSTESYVNIDGLVRTMEQILKTPFRTVIHPYEKSIYEERSDD